MKVARGLKGKILGKVDDGLGNTCTTVRLKLRDLNDCIARERASQPAPLFTRVDKRMQWRQDMERTASGALKLKWRSEAKRINAYLAEQKAKGQEITHILWHFDTPIAPALHDVLFAHPEVRCVPTEQMLPNDLKYLTTAEFEDLRAKALEKTGRPLEWKRPEKAEAAT